MLFEKKHGHQIESVNLMYDLESPKVNTLVKTTKNERMKKLKINKHWSFLYLYRPRGASWPGAQEVGGSNPRRSSFSFCRRDAYVSRWFP